MHVPLCRASVVLPVFLALGPRCVSPGGRSEVWYSLSPSPPLSGWSVVVRPHQQPCGWGNSESRAGWASYIHNYSSSYCMPSGDARRKPSQDSRTNGTVRPSEGGRERRAQREDVGYGVGSAQGCLHLQ
ncbi:hypothetical protein BGZ57DRAFT_191926 [Hyaloscypha finlandica]|nr:hypothetical protein BGZ57DRAFT_191926 [Hyaloscypha finlandica]